MLTAHQKPRSETPARRVVGTLALVGGMLCSDPEAAVAAQTGETAAQTTGEPMGKTDVLAASSGSLPRSVKYGAVAGLFLLVAAGVGAHKKH